MSDRDLPLNRRKKCGIETFIDHEGMYDLECGENIGHWGFHRYSDENMTVLWDFNPDGKLAACSSHAVRESAKKQGIIT